jgi:hypothetical protein
MRNFRAPHRTAATPIHLNRVAVFAILSAKRRRLFAFPKLLSRDALLSGLR